jgi:hypothetical protein
MMIPFCRPDGAGAEDLVAAHLEPHLVPVADRSLVRQVVQIPRLEAYMRRALGLMITKGAVYTSSLQPLLVEPITRSQVTATCGHMAGEP